MEFGRTAKSTPRRNPGNSQSPTPTPAVVPVIVADWSVPVIAAELSGPDTRLTPAVTPLIITSVETSPSSVPTSTPIYASLHPYQHPPSQQCCLHIQAPEPVKQTCCHRPVLVLPPSCQLLQMLPERLRLLPPISFRSRSRRAVSPTCSATPTHPLSVDTGVPDSHD